MLTIICGKNGKTQRINKNIYRHVKACLVNKEERICLCRSFVNMMKTVLMNKMGLMIVCAALFSCGVKGPPEPPLPTEASLKKEQKEKETEEQKKSKRP
jgi:predicted small lipoprotein YifL